MKDDFNQHHRKSTRLSGYDYSAAGWYFVTICVHDWEYLFGKIAAEQMVLNEFGQIVEQEWLRTPKIRLNVGLEEFVVMPNHFHGILVIEYSMKNDNHDDGRGVKSGGRGVKSGDRGVKSGDRGVMHYAPTATGTTQLKSPSQTLGAIVRGFKSAVTKQINEIRKTPGQPVWQRNFYDRIIRNDRELFNIRQYIINNPMKWEMDKENPQNWEML